MEKRVFDVIVIGAGSGLTISAEAATRGLRVAVVNEGPFGGTCLNRGCIPSKMLIHVADVMEAIRHAHTLNIQTKSASVNWKRLQKRVWSFIDRDARSIEQGNRETKNITVFAKRGAFVGHKTLKVGTEYVTADKIFICAGTRPSIPEMSGLDDVPYMTSDNVMRLKQQPNSMIILGGGYIAAELGHFFSSTGTKVTLINRSGALVRNEDEEVSEAFTKIVQKKYSVLLNTNVLGIKKQGKHVVVQTEQGGKKRVITADVLLVATGRRPNTDILDVAATGVAMNKDGSVHVNEYMETNVPGIWAIGDIAGVYLFKHSANLEAKVCAQNVFSQGAKKKVDYHAMPHAVFASPQIASVGKTEQELKMNKIAYKVGTYRYYSTGMGRALEDREGFVKLLVDPSTRRILGCHILGTDASTLIHEVLVAMKAQLPVDHLASTIHIHPALSEVIQRAVWQIDAGE